MRSLMGTYFVTGKLSRRSVGRELEGKRIGCGKAVVAKEV